MVGKRKLPVLRPREGSHIFAAIMMTVIVATSYFNYKFASTGGWGPAPNQLPPAAENLKQSSSSTSPE